MLPPSLLLYMFRSHPKNKSGSTSLTDRNILFWQFGAKEGSGPFAGAAVTEFGWHDVNPPISGDPQGYLQLTTQNGDVAVLRWTVKPVFMKGEGKPALFDQGFWEMVSGTGQFTDKRGVGSVVIKPAEGSTLFMLEGEVGEKP
jgi:hypothetical protein